VIHSKLLKLRDRLGTLSDLLVGTLQSQSSIINCPELFCESLDQLVDESLSCVHGKDFQGDYRTGQLLLQKNSFFVLYKDRKVRNDLRIGDKALSTLQELPSLFFAIEDLDLQESVFNFFIVPEDGACVVHVVYIPESLRTGQLYRTSMM